MRISFIIPAHNEEQNIGPCLDSILTHSHGRFSEIIVVDNASSDQTANMARRRQGVRVIHEAQKGICYARECGRIAAIGDFLAYIDADSRLQEGWMEIAEQEFRDNPNAVCLSGPPVYFDTSLLQSALLRSLWWSLAPLTYRIVGYMVYGAHFVVKRTALDAIGGFDCAIEFYGEDTDIARRLKTVGNVLFRMKCQILTSARRFSAEGLLKTSAIYALNFLWPVIYQKPFSIHHRDIR